MPEKVKWLAVVTRDPSAKVLYGVRSTRIYCRASCPARLARRANVVFFDTPEEAEQAGFRACKRCSPRDFSGEGQTQLNVAKGCEAIARAVREGRVAKLGELAAGAGLTPSYYHRVFKKVMGVTPGQYAAACRAGDVASPVSESDYDCRDDGFMDQFVDWHNEA